MSDEEIVYVTRRQIEAAKLAIKLAGGEDKVDPFVVKVAHVERRSDRHADGSVSQEAP